MRNLIVFTAVLALAVLGSAGIANAETFSSLSVVSGGGDAYLHKIENVNSSPTQVRFSIGNTAPQGLFEIDVAASGNTIFQTGKTNNSPTLSILSGNVGIGTMNPSAKLHVAGGSVAVDAGGWFDIQGGFGNRLITYAGAGMLFAVSPTEGFSFVSGGAENVRIQSNGNVGIGTTSPAAKLDVDGNIIADYVDTLDVSVVINGNSVSVAGLLAQIGGLQTQITALQDVINDLPPGLRNIDRNGDGL